MSSDTRSSRNQDQLEFRTAVRADVAAIVTLLADDVLGSTRELPGDDGADAYLQAFDEISADPNQLLCVATRAGEVVATARRVDALQELAKIDPDKAKIVELRYFGGLSIEETAEVMGVSVPTINRHWKLAKAWLYSQVAPSS